MEMDCECPSGRHDSNIQPATVRINPFTHNIPLFLFDLMESRVNLLRGNPPQVRQLLVFLLSLADIKVNFTQL